MFKHFLLFPLIMVVLFDSGDSSIESSTMVERMFTISVPKISLIQHVYPDSEEKNQISHHVMFLKESDFPGEANGVVILAAHSGSGNNAYFDRLKYLDKGDDIFLIYQGKTYRYVLRNIMEKSKNGRLRFNRYGQDAVLYLITCKWGERDKQLIYQSYLTPK